MKRVIFTAVFVLMIVALLWYAFRPVPVDVELGAIELGTLQVTLDHEGKTRVKELHVIHHDACLSCGACFDVCPTEAIRTFPKVQLKSAEVV